MNQSEKELRLSKYLLNKYSDIINEREQRTIGEIKTFVDGNDLTIRSIVEEFKESAYSFDRDYKEILKKVFSFIKEELEFIEVSFGVNYWLSAKDIMEIKIVDDEDMAVFTCACMKALGDNRAEVIIAELENLKMHAFVATEIDKKFMILDATQNHEIEKYFADKPEVLKKYNFNGQKIKRFLYRFNSDKYEQFLEED